MAKSENSGTSQITFFYIYLETGQKFFHVICFHLSLGFTCDYAFLVFNPQPMFHSPTTNGFGATTMLKKRLHNHYFNQTNPKKQPKQKTKPKKQPIVKLLHTKVLQQQPKIN